MKRNIFTCLLIMGILLLSTSLNYEEGKYYYAFDEKVPLIAKTNTVLVKYVDGIERTKAIESIKSISTDFNIKWHDSLTVEISSNLKKSTDELLTHLKQDDKVYTYQPFYTLKDGLEMGVTNEILVRLLPNVAEMQQQKLQKDFGTEPSSIL